MKTLIKTVRLIIWTVVLTLTTGIAGVCLFGAYRIVAVTKWENYMDIFKTVGLLFVLIFMTFVAGGFILWAIRENLLPLSPEEKKESPAKEE